MSENFSSGDSGIRLLCFATPSSEFVVIKIKEFQADYTSETLWKLNNSKSLYPTFTRDFLTPKQVGQLHQRSNSVENMRQTRNWWKGMFGFVGHRKQQKWFAG